MVLGLVSFRVFPTHMGGQKGVALFYRYLKLEMPLVLALSNDNKGSEEIESYAWLYPNKVIYRNLFRIHKLKQLVRDRRIEIIMAEHSYTGWLAWLLNKPFIIHSHNMESRRFRQMHKWWWRIYAWYEGWIHRKADQNFFISDEDQSFAISKFRLDASRCSVITYGFQEQAIDSDRQALKKSLGLDPEKYLLMFNGTLDYQPNYEAVLALIEKIDPLLEKRLGSYQFIITGNRAPSELVNKMLDCPRLQYMGYVSDVNIYYQAADLFLNPVANDSGVKTKLIEAIGNNCTAISTISGSSGIRKDLCSNKLVCVADDDWNSFADRVMENLHQNEQTPRAFYDYYSWKRIAEKAAEKIKELIANERSS